MSEYIAPVDTPQTVVDSWKTLVERGDNRFVSVNESVLDEIAAQNPDLEVPDWKKYFEGQHADNDWAFATQIVLTSAINYFFLNRDIKKDGESWTMENPETKQPISGSTALHVRTYQIFGEKEDINAREIEALIQPQTFERYLGNIPMAESRRRLLGDFALGLRNEYGGSVRELLNASVDHSGDLRLFNDGQGLVDRLVSEDFGAAFTDTSKIGDLVFPFNKRANLAGILLYGRSLKSDTLPQIADIEKSGSAPDYRKPQAWRALGATAYSSELSHFVDSYTEIEHDSQAEVEIRGADTYASKRLLQKTNEIRGVNGQTPYNEAHIDFWTWKTGQNLKKQGDTSLPHYTETEAY